MIVTIRESVDGDRFWIDVDGKPVAFIRTGTLECAGEVASDWGPIELRRVA